MSNSDKLLEFWERSLEKAFTRSMVRAPILIGDRTQEPMPFQISVQNNPMNDTIEITGRYVLEARQVISAMEMELRNPDMFGMMEQTAGRVVRRAIARRLIEDATTILAEGERPATLMGMDVIVSQNLPENVGMIVHPRQWAFLISSISMGVHNQLEWHNPNT